MIKTNTIDQSVVALSAISVFPTGSSFSDSATKHFPVKKISTALRTFIAVTLFVVAGIVSVGSNLDIAYAKKAAHRVASRMRDVKSKGQFRLLNIYNSLKASNARMVDSMNHATNGLASWYGGMFHGRLTAMGTRYNMNAMTAAHRTLPLGTWVKVTNETNGESAIVEVTDRGPYVANRIMDLSSAAAIQLGYKNKGTTKIDMKIIGKGYASAEEAQAALGSTQQGASFAANTSTDMMSNSTTIDSTKVRVPAMIASAAGFLGISTRTNNIPVSAQKNVDANPADIGTLMSAITTIATGSPIHSVATMFA